MGETITALPRNALLRKSNAWIGGQLAKVKLFIFSPEIERFLGCLQNRLKGVTGVGLNFFPNIVQHHPGDYNHYR